MEQVLHIPFESYKRLKRWYRHSQRPDAPDAEYYNRCLRVYYEGMKHWFENMPPTIRVYDYDNGGQDQYADVQFEMKVEGQSTQVYLMTLVTPRFVSEERVCAGDFGIEELDFGKPLEQIEDPFGTPTVVWDCDVLTPDTIVDAIEAWSEKFWPDFQCDYAFEALEGMEPAMLEGDFREGEDFERLVEPQFSHCRVLLQCEASQVDRIQEWAKSKGCSSIYVSQNYMVLLDGFPREAVTAIKTNWPDLTFVAASPNS